MTTKGSGSRRGRIGRLLIVSALALAAGCAQAAYQHMNDPSRDAWQNPTEVVKQLGLRPGDRVADVGAGGGYFTWFLADAVGPQGIIYAVDIDDTALRIVSDELRSRRLVNVIPIRATSVDANLPEPVDLVFSCDTYHHLDDRVAYFRSLRQYLKPHAHIAIVDFHPRGFFSGLLGHGTAADLVRREMEAAGYRFVAAHDVVESQHFQIFSAPAR